MHARAKVRGLYPLFGHDALNSDTEPRAGSCATAFKNATALRLRSSFPIFAKGDAGCIVNADVDVPPAGAMAVALLGAITCDPVADAFEFAKLFDVDVDELGWMFALIAAHWSSRLESFEAVQSKAPKDPADGRGGDPDLRSDLLAGVTVATQLRDLVHR